MVNSIELHVLSPNQFTSIITYFKPILTTQAKTKPSGINIQLKIKDKNPKSISHGIIHKTNIFVIRATVENLSKKYKIKGRVMIIADNVADNSLITNSKNIYARVYVRIYVINFSSIIGDK